MEQDLPWELEQTHKRIGNASALGGPRQAADGHVKQEPRDSPWQSHTGGQRCGRTSGADSRATGRVANTTGGSGDGNRPPNRPVGKYWGPVDRLRWYFEWEDFIGLIWGWLAESSDGRARLIEALPATTYKKSGLILPWNGSHYSDHRDSNGHSVPGVLTHFFAIGGGRRREYGGNQFIDRMMQDHPRAAEELWWIIDAARETACHGRY